MQYFANFVFTTEQKSIMKTIFFIGNSFLLIAFLFPTSLPGQSKEELERKQREIRKNIAYTDRLLKETSDEKESSYNDLLIINKKIQLRDQLLNNIKSEIERVKEQVEENKEIIKSLEKDLEVMKKEYERMIVEAYKNRHSYNDMMFILSSEDFNQAYRRLKYMEQITEARKRQAESIRYTQAQLTEKNKRLQEHKKEQIELIAEQREEGIKLEQEKKKQSRVLKTLKEEEKELQAKLSEQRRISRQLDNKIQEIIRKEAEASTPSGTSTTYKMTPEEKLVSQNFGKNMGRLPWPTETGVITIGFGSQRDPDGYSWVSNGIYISTTQGSTARAIFKGKVSSVFAVPGAQKAVIIRHGNYLTVYYNLTDVYVKNGQQVNAKESIGKVYTDGRDDKTTLHLQIWKEEGRNRIKLNPEPWLSRSN
jgi:septal ring factor EnvC (AmiA/AmiB activator)